MKIWAKPTLRNVKSPLPVDVGRSKSPLLTFPNVGRSGGWGRGDSHMKGRG